MTATEHKPVWYYLKEICSCTPKNFLGLGLFLLVFYFLTGKTSEKYHDTNFDYLLFTQRWLPTACINFIERPSSFSRRCTLPVDFKMWAIHGLWPTENNHMGPFFCNTSMIFDLKTLEQIERDLMVYWPNIQGGEDSSSLWKHEWEKHGTCAAQLYFLNTELKYFSTTLALYKKYNIGNILRSYSIIPSLSQGYSLSDLFKSLQNGLGKIPQIHCIFETHTNQPYLFEIRMCFNKNLDLIDCQDKKFDSLSALTNCPGDRSIIYPETAAPPARYKGYLEDAEKNFRQQLFDLLQLIRFIQWIILMQVV